MSGLHISLEKSTLFLAGVCEDREAILAQFPFEVGTLPVRCLGVPLLTKRMTSSDYSPLINRVKKRITSWTARQLSLAGRLQLINSVIHSITNFWMSVYRLPKQCIKEIDQLCSSFLWFGPTMSTTKAKISWDKVCTPKEEGRLGLRSLSETNKVCCLKLIWRILSQSTLWVKWVKRYLIRKGSFWSISDTSSLGSWIWKKLLKYRTLARSYVKIELRSGATTSFWFDEWSPLGRIMDLTQMKGCIALGINLNATVEFVIQHYRSRHYRAEHLITIDKEILRLRAQGLTDEDDVVKWRRSGDVFRPCFDTHQTWNSTRVHQSKVQWYKGLWFAGSTPKYSVMSWIAVHNRLATGDRLLQWNSQANAQCILCNAAVESRNHLFLAAPSRRLFGGTSQGSFWDSTTPTYGIKLLILSRRTLSHG